MKTLFPGLFLLFCISAMQAQPVTYVVDNFDPGGAGGYSYSGGKIGSVWGNWFGSAFKSLTWDSTSDASNNPSSGSMKISAMFNSTSNQFEIYNNAYPISPPLSGYQYTNFQCDVRFDASSATTTNGGVVSFGHLQFGVETPGFGQDYFGSVDVLATNTNWVHVSIPIDPTSDTNLIQFSVLLIHIYGPFYSSGLNGASTLWVDNIQFIGAPPPTAGACTVDWNDVHQRIDGFGASSAWQSTWTSKQADMLFSTNNGIVYTNKDKTVVSTNNGIGLSLLRTRIAPGGTTVENNIMQMAQTRGARVWSSPWSPAANFKSNTNVNGGSFVGTPANYQAYANQLAGYVAAVQRNYGVSLYALSVQNEPDAIVNSYESCNWSAQQIHDFVPYLYNSLVASNVGSTQIILPESQNWLDYSNLASTAMNDAAVAADVSIIADHNYDGTSGPGNLTKNSYGKALWETEVSLLSGSDGSIANGVYYAQRVHLFLTQAQVNAWHYWWLMTGNSTGNEGLMDTNANPTKRMFALGQFSRFVRPNYYRIGVTNNGPIQVSAFKDSLSASFALVAINSSSVVVTQAFAFTNFTAASSLTPWVTSATLSLASQTAVAVTNGSFSYSLPAMSVVTFVGSADLAPTNILLSGSSVKENLPAGASVGSLSTLTPIPGNTFTYSLVSGPGGGDNAKFGISGNALSTATFLDAAVQNQASIRLRSTDQAGLFMEQTFNIAVLPDSQARKVVSIVPGAGGNPTLTFAGIPGQTYHVLMATNLVPPVPWRPITNSINGTTNFTSNGSGLWSCTDTNAAGSPYRFYRSVEP
jgi:glucuronoarabinoxylan endo-1,4-beta-xylanase